MALGGLQYNMPHPCKALDCDALDRKEHMERSLKSKTELLISEINRLAEFASENGQREVSDDLYYTARQITGDSGSNAVLVKFSEYAYHYKGLRDVYFPNQEKLWSQMVKCVQSRLRAVMLERGQIKPCPLERLIMKLKYE
jgi:hypothetical protein